MLHTDFINLVHASPEAQVRQNSLCNTLEQMERYVMVLRTLCSVASTEEGYVDMIDGFKVDPASLEEEFNPETYTDAAKSIQALASTLNKNVKAVYTYTLSRQPKAAKSIDA